MSIQNGDILVSVEYDLSFGVSIATYPGPLFTKQ